MINSIPFKPYGASSKSNVLIVGSDGMIGAALKSHLILKGYQALGTTRRPGLVASNSIFIDLQDPKTLNNLSEEHFDTAVLCGAVTSLKTCEENPDYAQAINVDGTIALAKILAKAGTHLIFISTNMVFDGGKSNNCVSDIKIPANQYGMQKSTVEDWLLSAIPTAAIIRFGKVLPRELSLFTQWQEELLANKKISPYYGKTMAPISLDLAIKILTWMVDTKKPGIFQATASSDITYVDAALFLAHYCNASPDLIEPVIAPPLTDSDVQESHQFLFSTLQFSSDFAHICTAPSPIDALYYSMPQARS